MKLRRNNVKSTLSVRNFTNSSTSQRANQAISGGQTGSRGFHFFVGQSFRASLPRPSRPAPTAEIQPQGCRAVYTTHSPVGYLPRDVASLHIRYKQLIRLDFHQLDCSLAGCSDVPLFIQSFQLQAPLWAPLYPFSNHFNPLPWPDPELLFLREGKEMTVETETRGRQH